MRTKLTMALLLACAPALADPPKPRDRFADAEKSFKDAKAMLMKDYVDDLSDEDLYRAAVAGMLSAGGRKWDALMSPSEAADMQAEFAGNLVGVGIELDTDTEKGNFPLIISTFPGAPAEKAGVLAGDRIVRIDGKSVKGPTPDDILRRIRGKAGTSVKLTLLRDDQMIDRTMQRTPLTVSAVSQATVNGVPVVWVRVFNEKTPELLRGALSALPAGRGFVLDLRSNQGGLFDKMIDCATMLLPKGSLVVTEVQRAGHEQAVRTSGESLVGARSMVVLTDGMTASSAEVLAGALRDTLGVRIVGARTHGKWNLQRVETLPNGYAMKYTIGVFRTPKGQMPDGKGIDPDLPVDLDELTIARAQRTSDPQKRLVMDAQLRAALALIK